MIGKTSKKQIIKKANFFAFLLIIHADFIW